MKEVKIQKGDKYNRLTIDCEISQRHNKRRFHCQCECGNFVDVYLFALRTGNTKSCGCLRDEKSIERNIQSIGKKKNRYIKKSDYWLHISKIRKSKKENIYDN